VPTLVLSPRYTPDSNALWKAAIEQGWAVERLHSHQPPDHLRYQQIILYGEGLFVRLVASVLEIALFEPPFDWLPSLPTQYRHREIYSTTLSAARTRREPAFIKPAIDKSFDAKIYSSGQSLPEPDVYLETMLVLVSEPVEWEIEYRCFVRDRQILTCSLYKRNGQALDEGQYQSSPADPDGVLAFSELLLGDTAVELPPAVVIDVGYIRGRGWAVIEANPAWASGIYGCSSAAVLNVIAGASIRESDLGESDKRWVNWDG
jgi:hypothetical protein